MRAGQINDDTYTSYTVDSSKISPSSRVERTVFKALFETPKLTKNDKKGHPFKTYVEFSRLKTCQT